MGNKTLLSFSLSMRSLFYNNIKYSFIAQFLQLSLSISISLFLPFLLGVEDFGYWQLFIFYTQYAGFLAFGLVDGIYLREGGKKYSELNFRSIAFQQRMLFLLNFTFFIVLVFFSSFASNLNRSYVIISSGVFMLVSNTTNFYSMLLSAVHEIKTASIGRMFFSISFLTFVLVSLFILRIDNYKFYILAYIICYSFNLFYCLRKSRDINKFVFSKTGWEFKQELFDNIKHGFVLTIANVAGMLLLGITRFFIDSQWGIEVFGMVSYSLVIVNFVLMFIAQLSLVMYPELRSMKKEILNNLFTKIQHALLLLTPLILLSFFPISYLIEVFLPDYIKAAHFMIYMLPICIFEAKVMLQTNTYFKVHNKPKAMMLSNVEALIFGIVISAVSVFCCENMTLAVVSMPLTIFLQYVFSLKRLRPNSYIEDLKTIMPESSLIIFFVLVSILVMNKALAIVIYVGAVSVYYCYFKNVIKDTFTNLLRWNSRKNFLNPFS